MSEKGGLKAAKFTLAGIWIFVSVLVWIPFGPEWAHLFKQALYVLVAWAPLFIIARFERQPKWQRGLCVSILMFSLGLFFLDLAIRPVMNDPIVHQRYPAMPILWRLTPAKDATLKVHQDLARISGDLTTFPMVETRVVTDHRGFRNDMATMRKPINLILLGDSFGVGLVANQHKTWGHLFSTVYEMNCFNMSAVGTAWHEVLTLTLESPSLELDEGGVVIWAIFTGNDLDGTYGEFPFPTPDGNFFQVLTKLTTHRKKSPVRSLFSEKPTPSEEDKKVAAVEMKGRDILFYEKYDLSASRSVSEVEAHPNFTMMSTMFSEMRRVAETRNLQVVVVLIPTKGETYPYLLSGRDDLLTPDLRQGKASGFSTVVESLCLREEFPFLDLKPSFFQEALRRWDESNDLLWWEADTHWNGAGHALAARETAAFLRSSGLLDGAPGGGND